MSVFALPALALLVLLPLLVLVIAAAAAISPRRKLAAPAPLTTVGHREIGRH
jgi:hypothetical protein